EYEAFYRKQPFGLWREDYRMAQVVHLLAMINRDPKTSPPELMDFMPMWQKKAAEETWDAVTDQVLAYR
ncbi:phage tail assembly protein T, partial [Proteus mirabilis]